MISRHLSLSSLGDENNLAEDKVWTYLPVGESTCHFHTLITISRAESRSTAIAHFHAFRLK